MPNKLKQKMSEGKSVVYPLFEKKLFNLLREFTAVKEEKVCRFCKGEHGSGTPHRIERNALYFLEILAGFLLSRFEHEIGKKSEGLKIDGHEVVMSFDWKRKK